MKHPKRSYKLLVVALFAAAVVAVLAARSFAFIGPTTSSGNGSGAIGVGSGGTVSIGTTSPAAGTIFTVVGSSSDANYTAMKVFNSSLAPLYFIRNDGSIAA